MTSSLDRLKTRFYDINALNAATAILDWDQQTYMPKGGAQARAEHLSILSRMFHEMLTSDETGRLIEEASKEVEVEPETENAALVRVCKRRFDLNTKIPTALVAEKAHLSSEAHEKWVQARSANDFSGFAPILERMFEIVRQEAEHLGYKEHIYDALLDIYEEGATAADCKRMFDTIKAPSVDLIKAIKEQPQTDDRALYGSWEEQKQRSLTEKLLKDIGFDFNRGRQDTAPHPFCTGFSIDDVRLTTRYKEYLPSAIFGSLHEAGHGMYEQGSPRAWDRTPLAGGVSLGVHESQSRTWENIVGRSHAFWKRYLPRVQELFPTLSNLSTDQFYRMINKVQPSLIRVEADELTYNLHILIRFEIECDVLTGALSIKDLPEAWNTKYEQYLGIRPTTDSEGCLQDVHWSMGAIGYFPTYSMGNLLSYQIWKALEKDLGDTATLIEKGDFGQILGWLTKHIYSKGQLYTPRELIQRATGKAMEADDYLAALAAKYSNIYQLS